MQHLRRAGLGRVARAQRWFAVLLAVVVLATTNCGRNSAGPPQPTGPAEVTAITVEPRDAPVSFELVAQTQSSRQVNIQARVSGFLDKRVYTEGSLVKVGDVLFLMDPRPFQAQVDAHAAELAKQQASLEMARANLERTKPLAAQDALSQKDLDDATGQFHHAEASVEEAKARLQAAQLDLSYCTITSPLSGISGAAVQQDGAYISPSNSLLTTVAALNPIYVNFSVSENEMRDFEDQVASGQLRVPADGNFSVEVVLVDGSIFPHTGQITFAAPSYNAATGTFLLRASVANPAGVLRPNQYVRVRLHGATRPAAILIPQRAVQQGSAGHFVWVVGEGSTAEARPVTVGRWQGRDWFITEGLRAGDEVVVDGGQGLRAGVPVAAKPAGAEPPSGSGQNG